MLCACEDGVHEARAWADPPPLVLSARGETEIVSHRGIEAY